MTHLWEPCLTCLSIKINYLFLNSQETFWPGPPVNCYRKKEISSFLPESGWNQEIFATIYHLFVLYLFTPPSLLYKRNCYLTSWTVDHQAPLAVGFSRQLEWVAMTFSRGSSQPRDGTHTSCTAGGFFYCWSNREAL